MLIYKATNKINGKVYIGQTTRTLRHRRKQHEASSRRESTRIYFWRALSKYKPENFEWVVIDKAISQQELNKKESEWIEYYESTNPKKGYNSKGGGHNPFLTQSVKDKIGNAQKGELNHMYGKKGAKSKSSTPVINLTTNIRYGSASECAEVEGIGISKVCAVCRGERATTNNNVYRYIDKETGKIQHIECHVKKKTKAVINLDTGEKFPSIKEAERKYKPNSTNFDSLTQALKRNNGACIWLEHKWKFEDNQIGYDEIQKKVRKDAQKVKNLTTGEIFPSITSVGKNYRNLATALRKGNGKCFYQKQHWEIVD